MTGVLAVGVGVLAAQARAAKRTIGPQTVVPPYQDGRFGPATGKSLRLALIGDSVAAGLGADTAADTVAGVLVRGVFRGQQAARDDDQPRGGGRQVV